jgi:hypothetical protein
MEDAQNIQMLYEIRHMDQQWGAGNRSRYLKNHIRDLYKEMIFIKEARKCTHTHH